jgi:hypothetical protein
MKKNTLLLVGLGAVALLFLMRRGTAQGRRRGILEVESPEIMTEQEFGVPTVADNEPRSLVDTVQNIAQRGGEIFSNVRESLSQNKNNQMIYLPGTAIPTGLTARKIAQLKRQKRQQEARAKRQQARTTRKAKRQQARTTRKTQRRVRRQRVGEIGVLF